MKSSLLLFGLLAVMASPSISRADGPPDSLGGSAPRRNPRAIAAKEEAPPEAPVCVPKSANPKVRIIGWNPNQKVSKFLGEIQECVSTQWDVLALLSGPNAIGLRYPEEREMWSYLWLWRYKLANPVEDTIIMMDHPGKRILKGKDPVELRITYNAQDVVERVELDLIKKKGDYVLFP